MNVEVRGLNVTVPESIRAHAQRRLEFALGRFPGHVRLAQVRLSDTNGHRGGVDKRCQVEVRMRSLAPLRVEVMDSGLLAAIDRAADRLGRAVSREIERGRAPVRVAAHPG